MSFSPIAIVGRGCVLPGALNPQELGRNMLSATVSLLPLPAQRRRQAPVGAAAPEQRAAVGGYVTGFETSFDPSGFAVDTDQVRALDPAVRWVMAAMRQAMRESRHEGDRDRVGLVLATLACPTTSMIGYAEEVWLRDQPAAVRETWSRITDRPASGWERFCAGRPAQLAARAMGLGGGAFALDAACASALYAIKYACDRLHRHTADLMLATAVNGADPLLVRNGSTNLGALSPTGQSRPFHREADGLVPAEGAVSVALMRLADALAAGVPVLGVVRGIGLTNDGRAGGLLAPSSGQQERAMELAYAAAGVDPATVSLVECHATGTRIGDATEVHSLARIFGHSRDVPIGSAKGNIGHALTAAAGVGLLKVLASMEAGVRPATVGADEPMSELADTPLRLLRDAEEWSGPRRAAVSGFGFGGTNGHLVVDDWPTGSETPIPTPRPAEAPDPDTLRTVAVVGMGVRAGTIDSTADFVRALMRGTPNQERCDDLTFALEGLRFPPRDFAVTPPEQLMVFEAAREAVHGIELPADRTSVLVGMGCHPMLAQQAVWGHASAMGENPAKDGPKMGGLADEDPFASPTTAVAALANIAANRISVQFDLHGPSLSVCAEEASGIQALSLAELAIATGEADAALVGAVDLAHDPVHLAALDDIGRAVAPADAAVVLVLKPLEDARRQGDRVLAVLDMRREAGVESEPGPLAVLTVGDVAAESGADSGADSGAGVTAAISGVDPTAWFGRPHAASGLLSVACAAVALHHRARPRLGRLADTWPAPAHAEVIVTPLDSPRATLRLRPGDPAPWLDGSAPVLHTYSGADLPSVLRALAERRESTAGPARLCLMASDGAEFEALRDAADRWLRTDGSRPNGAGYQNRPIEGELAFVFPGMGTAYPGMATGLAHAFPDMADDMAALGDPELVRWAQDDSGGAAEPPSALRHLYALWVLSVFHARITREVLRLRPQASIGYSAGELNALSALGAWPDAKGMLADTHQSSLFTTEMAGPVHAIRRVWSQQGVHADRWTSFVVGASAEHVIDALAGQPAVHLLGINSPDCCTIGGAPEQCAAAIARMNAAYVVATNVDLAAHAPEVAELGPRLRQNMLRHTLPVPGVRFYSCGPSAPYAADAGAAADACTGTLLNTVDFMGTVRRAWDDGVRVFVEHGPLGSSSQWISQILADREHLTVALDAPEQNAASRFVDAIAQLAAAGVPLDAARFTERLRQNWYRRSGGHTMSVPVHYNLNVPGRHEADIAAPPSEVTPRGDSGMRESDVRESEPLQPVAARQPVRQSAQLQPPVPRQSPHRAEPLQRPSALRGIEPADLSRAPLARYEARVPAPGPVSSASASDPATVIAACYANSTAAHREILERSRRAQQEFARSQQYASDLLTAVLSGSIELPAAVTDTAPAPAAAPHRGATAVPPPAAIPVQPVPAPPDVITEPVAMAPPVTTGAVPAIPAIPAPVSEPREPLPHREEFVFDLTADAWLDDHRPTWTVPVVPMMCTLDLLAQAAARYTGERVRGIQDLRLERWAVVVRPTRFVTEVVSVDPGASPTDPTSVRMRLLVWRQARRAALSRFEPVAEGLVLMGEPGPAPAPFAPLEDAHEMPSPYLANALPHGPAFQYLTRHRCAGSGSDGDMDAARGSVPAGLLRPGLLDAATHTVPGDEMWRWCGELAGARFPLPHCVVKLESYLPLPETGDVRVEVRFRGFDDEANRFPVMDYQLSVAGVVHTWFRVMGIMLPKGELVGTRPALRKRFLLDRQPTAGLRMSTFEDGTTVLGAAAVDEMDWPEGAVAYVYGLPPGVLGRDYLAEIAISEHVAEFAGVHPADVEVSSDRTMAWPRQRPSEQHRVCVRRDGTRVLVTDDVDTQGGGTE